LGDAAACERAIEAYERIKPHNSDIVAEKHKLQELKKYIADVDITTHRKDFRRVVFLCDRILEISIGDVNTKTRKAFALIKLGRHNDAAELAAEIMALNPQSIDAHIIRAICHYMLDNMDKSLCFFRGGLQYNPDAEEPKILYRKVKQIKEQREAATDFYKQGKYEESKALYTEIMKEVVAEGELKNTNLECKFSFNLSLIFNKQRNYDEALKYVSRAIELNDSYYKAFVHRGTVYTSKEMHEEAIRDLEVRSKIKQPKD
jgi:tetratricopeptide (TPR) repeat protein